MAIPWLSRILRTHHELEEVNDQTFHTNKKKSVESAKVRAGTVK